MFAMWKTKVTAAKGSWRRGKEPQITQISRIKGFNGVIIGKYTR